MNKRKALKERYKRKTSDSELIYGKDNKKTKIPLEKYLVDIASGVKGGKSPSYQVSMITDNDKKELVKKIFDKKNIDEKTKKEMELIIDYIVNYNDDGDEHFNMVKDGLELTESIEYLYENSNNDYVYSKLDSTQAVAIYDYSIPTQLIGIVRVWEEQDVNSTEIEKVEIIDKERIRQFKNGDYWTEITPTDDYGKEIKTEHGWGDVPAVVAYTPDGIALFEPVVDLINSYEQLIQNTRNTFQYNDTDAKIGIEGYSPMNDPYIEKTKEDGTIEYVENPERVAEDEHILKSRIMYFPDGGKAYWIEKTVNSEPIQKVLKIYLDLICLLTGTPNVSDQAFTNAENASAIDRKFFALHQFLTSFMTSIKKAYKRRWELIFNRINNKKNTEYDFRLIDVILKDNVPTNEAETTDNLLKLKGTVSDESIIERLPYGFDYNVEKGRIENQEQETFNKNLDKIKTFNNNGDNDENNKEDSKNNFMDNKSNNATNNKRKENAEIPVEQK